MEALHVESLLHPREPLKEITARSRAVAPWLHSALTNVIMVQACLSSVAKNQALMDASLLYEGAMSLGL